MESQRGLEPSLGSTDKQEERTQRWLWAPTASLGVALD